MDARSVFFTVFLVNWHNGDPIQLARLQHPMNQDQPLADQVAIVTGGGWNIGRAIALRLSRIGAHVVIASRSEDRLKMVVDEITASGGSALAVPCDVMCLEQVEHLIEATVAHFGTVDIMASCAGGSGAHESIEDVDPQVWYDVVAKNLHGTFHCARCVLPIFRAKNSGHILTFTGGGAFFPWVGYFATAYASAKAGICRFTDQLQAELLDTNIRVNCVEPGMVWSPDKIKAVEAQEQESGQPHPDRASNHPPESAAELVESLTTGPGTAIRGRIVSVNDSWWRDPDEIRAVEDSLTMYRLRRYDGT